MAYGTFIGRDGQNAAFSWVTQVINGVPAMVMVLDVAGAPVSSSNPLPVSAPSNLPVAVQGTVPVSVAATLQTLTPPDAAPLSSPTGVSIGTSSTQLAVQNLSRKRIEVCNWSTTAQVAVRFGANTAVIGTGLILPPQAQATYYTTAEIRVIASAAATLVSYVEW